MRKFLAVASLGAVAVFGGSMSAAQVEAPASRGYDLAGFEQVSVVGPHRVVISVGSGYSVRFDGPQQTLDDTEVEVEDGRLKIHPVEDERWERRRGGPASREYWGNYRAGTFHVTLPRLEAVSMVGGGTLSVDRVDGDRFAASLAGSGELDVAALRVDEARFSIAGSGDLSARGSARHARVSIAGSGNLRGREVTSEDASVSIAGSGNVELTVRDDARVSIVGSGDVDIAGPARCSVSRFGGGRVRCGGEDVDG